MSFADDIAARKAKPATFAESIAARKVSGARDARLANAEQSYDKREFDPTEGMSTPAKLGAGFQSGLRNVVRGVGNIAGVMSDEEVAEAKRLEGPLSKTKAGMVGQFGGEMAALAPMGAIGAPAKAAQAVAKAAPKLGKALKFMGSGAPRAVAEGAASGAILANPNERGQGAVLGGVLGGAGSKAGQLLNRAGHGLVKEGAKSRALRKTLGDDSFVPISQAADTATKSGAVAQKMYQGVGDVMPISGKMIRGQSKELTGEVGKASLKRAYGPGAKHALKVLDEGGTMREAIEAGEAWIRTTKPRYQAQTMSKRGPLLQAMAGKKGGEFTPTDLRKATQKIDEYKDPVTGLTKALKGSKAPHLKESELAEDVLGEAATKSNIQGRAMYYGNHPLARAVGGAAELGMLPVTAVMTALSSKSAQKILMGNTKLQQAYQKAVKSKNGERLNDILRAVNRTAAAQAGPQNEAEKFAQETKGFFGGQ